MPYPEYFKTAFANVQIDHPLSPESIEDLYNCCVLKECPKNTLLLKEGHVANTLCLMVKGLARSYFYRNGKEATSWITPENTPFTNFRSFITKEPSKEYIVAVEDCIYYEMTRENLYNLYDIHISMLQLGRIITENHFLRHDEYVYDLLFNTAEDRYKNFALNYPTLFDRMKRKDIASYLNMSPETLSRVRAKVTG